MAGGKPRPPLEVALALRPDRPRRGEVIDLVLSVGALADLARARVALRLPPEVRLITGDPVWEGPLAAGARHAAVVGVRVDVPGRYVLGARAEVLDGPYAGRVAGAVLLVDATAEELRWSPDPLGLAPPASRGSAPAPWAHPRDTARPVRPLRSA